MIKEKELREIRPQIRYQHGGDISLETVRDSLSDCASQTGISISFYTDQIKFGGLIGGSLENCLVLYHPEHENDYFKMAIRVTHQNSYVFVNVYGFGTSRLMDNVASHEITMEALKHGSGTQKVGAVIGAGLRRMVKGGRNSQKLEEEQNWYAMVSDLFDEFLS